MSIFSSIKQSFHNRKLKQADEYVSEGNYDKAESIYKNLIPDLPEAATHLAEMYFEHPSNDNMDVEHYRKILNCRSLINNNFFSSDSFDSVEKAVFKEIDSIINLLIDEKKYNEITTWVDFIVSRNRNLAPAQKNEYVLLDSKCHYNYALDLIKQNRREAEKIFEDIYKKSELYSSFPSDYVLKTRNKILSIATNYVNEHDLINANHFLKMIITKDPSAKDLFIKANISNINQIESDPTAINFLFDTINSIEDKKVVADCFEQLLGKAPAAEEQYILSIISISSDYINKKDYSSALGLLESAINKRPDNRLYNLQRDIAQNYISMSDYDRAIAVLLKLIGKHGDAEPLLAVCYLKKADKTDSLDTKRVELLKAFKFKETHDPLFNIALYSEIFPLVINNLLVLAKRYANYEFFKDAYSVLSLLFPYTQEAYEVHINAKLVEICKVSNVEKQLTLLDELIRFGEQKIKNPQDSKAIDNVFTTLIDKTLSKLSQKQDLEVKTNELSKLNQRISNGSFLSKESALLTIQRMLAEIYLKKGKDFELKSKIEDAINTYNLIISDLISWTREGLHRNDILGRIYICRLKKNDVNPEEIERFLMQEMSADIKKDLAYRFSIYLLKQQDYKQAWIIAQKYLPASSVTEKIRKACASYQINNARKLLDSYNEKIQQMDDDTLTLNEAIDLYEKLSETETSIAIALPDVKGKIIANKNILFSYIHRKYFENEKYIEYVYTTKKQYKQFYKDDNLLRNVAVASLGIIQTKRLDGNNYKDLISNWLTAVFCDRLFIKSLDYTSWDDPYSFTLYNSLGNIKEYENLPENINFEEPSPTNISIRDVQYSLLSEFEKELNDNCRPALLPNVLSFYNEEKDAISQLYQAIGSKKNFFGCTPFFAENYPEIHEVLDKYINDKLGNQFNESLLNIGILYRLEDKRYKDFSEAKILSNKSIEVIKAQNTAQIKLIFSLTNIGKIQIYSGLYDKLVSNIKNCLNEHINNPNNSYKDIIYNYLIICQVLPDQNLKFTLSNFAYNECLRGLNSNTISTQDALQLLIAVQKVIPDNTKLNNFIPDIRLSDLVEKFYYKKISLLDGLTATYNLYTSYPNHQRICENLVAVCNMAIQNEIMGDTSSSIKVQGILNNLIANKSSTFRVAAKELAIQYTKIIFELPKDIQTMILGGVVHGSSLNTKGEALKRGLNYLQRLSQ